MTDIKLTLDSERLNNFPTNYRFKQGNLNRRFIISPTDNGVDHVLSATDKISLYFAYLDTRGVILNYSPLIDETSPDYATIVAISELDNTVTVNPCYEMVDHAGKIRFTLKINDLYSYDVTYTVDKTDSYINQTFTTLKAIWDNKADIDLANVTTLDFSAKMVESGVDPNNTAQKDLLNVGEFAIAENGSMFYKKDNLLKEAPIFIDDVNGEVIFDYSLNIPPNSIYFGINTSIHENGGFLEYETETLETKYLLLDYENDPLTGTSHPVYYERGIKQTQYELQSDDSQVMPNVVQLNMGTPAFDKQIQKVYFKFANPATNFKMMINVNGKDVGDYPTNSYYDDSVAGYNFTYGLQSFDLEPFWSDLLSYNTILKIKADSQIDLLGSGTLPYIAIDMNEITEKYVALIEDIPDELTPVQVRDKLETLTGEDRLDATYVKNIQEQLSTEYEQFSNALVLQAWNDTLTGIPTGTFVNIYPKDGAYFMKAMTRANGYSGELIGLVKQPCGVGELCDVQIVTNVLTETTTASEGEIAYIGFEDASSDIIKIGLESELYEVFGQCGVFGDTNLSGEYYATFDVYSLISSYFAEQANVNRTHFINTQIATTIPTNYDLVHYRVEIDSGLSVTQNLPDYNDCYGMMLFIDVVGDYTTSLWLDGFNGQLVGEELSIELIGGSRAILTAYDDRWLVLPVQDELGLGTRIDGNGTAIINAQVIDFAEANVTTDANDKCTVSYANIFATNDLTSVSSTDFDNKLMSGTAYADLDSRIGIFENPDIIEVVKTVNLPLSTTPVTIDFGSVLVSNNITNTAGEITVTKDGLYVGNLVCYYTKVSAPYIWFYIEHMPLSTGIWEIYQNLGVKVKASTYTSSSVKLDGAMSLLAGDKIRIRAVLEGSGSVTLSSQTTVIGTTTITQHPAVLTMYKIN